MNISIIYDGTAAICKIDNKDFADCSTLDKYLAKRAINILKENLNI